MEKQRYFSRRDRELCVKNFAVFYVSRKSDFRCLLRICVFCCSSFFFDTSVTRILTDAAFSPAIEVVPGCVRF